MPRVQEDTIILPEEYLEREKHAELKHEYVAGQVYAMVGASTYHNRIALAFASILHAHLRGGPCDVFMSDIKVRTEQAFYYPDVMVSCDANDTDLYTKSRPLLIIEVESPTTRVIDEREKRVAYQAIDSMREYILAEQDCAEIRLYRRISDRDWRLEKFTADDELHLIAVDLVVPVRSIYENVWR